VQSLIAIPPLSTEISHHRICVNRQTDKRTDEQTNRQWKDGQQTQDGLTDDMKA